MNAPGVDRVESGEDRRHERPQMLHAVGWGANEPMPKGNVEMRCWNSMLRSIVTRTSYCPLIRRSSSPFLIPLQPRPETVSTV